MFARFKQHSYIVAHFQFDVVLANSGNWQHYAMHSTCMLSYTSTWLRMI